MKPNILIVNDDGIFAPGIKALAEAMESLGSITIVAPEKEQSGKSHSISLNTPIRIKPVKLKKSLKGWSVLGTPVDSAKIALKILLKRKPDLVISGINLGANLGKNLIYSGTVSAAFEGAILGIPSAAISLDSFKASRFSVAKDVAFSIANHLLKHKLPKGTMLNVNVPYINAKKLKGYLVTKQGELSFIDSYEKRVDPRGQSYYWIKGVIGNTDQSIEYDGEAVANGYVSITPIHYNITNKLYMNELKHKIIHE